MNQEQRDALEARLDVLARLRDALEELSNLDVQGWESWSVTYLPEKLGALEALSADLGEGQDALNELIAEGEEACEEFDSREEEEGEEG